MNLKRIIALLAVTAAVGSAAAQNMNEPLLTNYTYTGDRTVVGLVSSVAGGAEFRIKGGSKVFELAGDTLKIRPQYAISGKDFYDVSIEAKSATGVNKASFRILKDQFATNKVVAHRGAFKNTGAAENSIKALQHAVDMGCQGSEFDVHMSADSVLVVNHDRSIKGLNIAEATGNQLTAIKLSNGENLPTLEAYLKAGIKQHKTRLVLELKSTTSPERAVQQTQKVVKMVRDLKAQAWIDYISFDYVICKELLRLDPFAHVAYLNGDKAPEELKANGLWGFDYHFNVLKKNEAWIEQARKAGLTTNVWTVNDQESLQWFLDRNVDYITTNEPELLLKMVSK